MLAIYTRLSREDDDSTSIKNQIREGKAFAKLHNNKSFEIYNEGEGISGTLSVENRPALDQLIKDIISKKITVIWMRNQNRLERSTYTYHYFIKYAKENNISVYFGDKGKLDYNDPTTYLQGSILSAINQYAADLQSHQTKKSLLDNAKEGKFHGIPPYGYKKNENRVVVIDEEEAKVVRRIYALSLEGNGQSKIAEFLTADNIPTRYNKIGKGTLTTTNKFTKEKTTTKKSNITWSGNTIRGIITNTVYKGEKLYKGEIFKIEPIISAEYWQQVNDNLKNNRNTSGAKTNTYNYLLKGLIRCGKCGRNFYGRTRKDKKDHYYMCSSKRIKNENCGNRSINIDFIENFIWNQFFTNGLLRDRIEAYYDNSDEKQLLKQFAGELKKHNTDKENLLKEKSQTTKYLVKGILEEDEADQQLIRIRKQLNEIETKILNTESNIDFYKNKSQSVEEITADLTNIKKDATFNDKEILVNNYIQNIKVLFQYDNYIIDVEGYGLNTRIIYEVDRNYKYISEVDKLYYRWLEERKKGTIKLKFEEYIDNDINNSSFYQMPGEKKITIK
ncbi:recombinase family protein [Cochleicola gelatinilyticus]|uniref:Recombinase domain-containing protein n=1 Tax=Cochleicola gelatinilyticus TaxID=1763537 RepID=A0A167HM30_9FLAO|nr:recombinase family protein [Cochleicola gelatinilyticus]OAB78759.1 hypothetical protein ULVI_09260 [Cochleicola gelatinilyticus]